MDNVITFPSAAEREDTAIDRALVLFDAEGGRGEAIETLLRLALGGTDVAARGRAALFLSENFNVRFG